MAQVHDDRPRLKEVFAGARALPAGERSAYLAAACHGNEALREEVESLLSSDEHAKNFLEVPAVVRNDQVATTRNLEGQRIGSYQVGSRIGTGGMGEVYQARDLTLNRQVAIKVLLSDVAGNPDRLARFRREARVLASLNHPHVAQIHGFEDAGGVHALVMELVEGPTLADLIAGGEIPIHNALAIASQILAALENAHEQGIIHRDLKPANIKVREDGAVKVLDFGLAKALGAPDSADIDMLQSPAPLLPPTATGLILGTAAYMSPEQARGKPVDRRTDLWAFGCVLYEMLTRQRAFGGDNPTDALVAVVTTEPDWTRLPAETPVTIRTLLRRCLEKNRARRLDSALAARLEIDDALATPAVPTVDPQRIQTPDRVVPVSDRTSVRGRKRRWMLVAGVAAVAAAITAGVVWRLWQQDYFWQNPLAGAAVERLTDFAGEEADAAISPDGKFMTFLSDRDGPFDAWISQIGSGEFVNITKGRFQLINNPNIRSGGFSGDGAQVWFTQQVSARPLKWTSWIAPALGGAPRTFVEGGLEPIWSPDGRYVVYHTNNLGDPAFIVERNGSNPRQIYVAPPGVHAHYPTWSPDGRFIYFVRGTIATEELDIWRIPLSEAAAAPERITFHNARVAYPAWLDARTLIYSATAEDGSGQWLYALDVEHRIAHRVSSGGIAEEYHSVDVSRARPRRVVAAVAAPTAGLWTVPISDRVQTEDAVKPAPTPNSRARSPRFASGDAAFLAFLSSKGGADGLWKLENGAPLELWRGDEGGVVAPPAISPDGRYISFSYRRQGKSGLFIMNANGTNVRTLAADSFDVRGAATWSPDGKWIAVAANRGDGTRLFKIPMDGGPPVRLLDTLSYHPAWSPDGRFIVYAEQQSAGQFEVRAITPDQKPVPIVELQIVGFNTSTPYRFLPDGNALIVLEGVLGISQNFFRVELASGQRRQLTDLKAGAVIRDFDVSPDGTQIVFDRIRNNTDIVSMNLAR